MNRRLLSVWRSDLGLNVLLVVCLGLWANSVAGDEVANEVSEEAQTAKTLEEDVTQGALRVVQRDGTLVECPLKHTDVQADISGFIARVKVTQTFHNPLDEKIEAVYVFPLPHEASVDDMTMVIGERRIVGVIKRRAEARQIYEQALAAGQTASLLEQQRPNIFKQSVGNLEPAQEVRIEISYVDVLRYDLGTYEFQFPMVVGPRYIPGSSLSTPADTPPELQGKVSPPVANTDRVPDAEHISPPVLKPGFRNGHDVSLTVTLDAGVPVQDLNIANHKATIQKQGDRQATIQIDPADSIPNKDFLLRYDVTGAKPELAVLAHTGEATDARRLGNGYFLLMIQPQEDERLVKSPPREIVFLVDVSGSMSGEPTMKVIEAMQAMLKLCRPQDTVQVITFASEAHRLFEKPLPVTEPTIVRALNFTSALQGSGGTEMLKGVKIAIDEPIDAERLRIVVMLTDGYIGNESEIIEHVGKHCGDQIRFWCIGIGSSPNMFLVDGVAKQGGGMGKQLGLQDDTNALTQEVMTRIQRAQLSNVQIDWGGLKVAETYPARVPELWAGRPVILVGRYSGGGEATVTVRGSVEGEPAEWPLTVSLPSERAEHGVLAKIWARRKIEDLMQQTYYAGSPAVEEEVTAIALDYRLMTQYTSFVAVDESQAAQASAARPKQMLVPVPLPDGTQWEGFFGPANENAPHPDAALMSYSKSHAWYGAQGVAQKVAGVTLGKVMLRAESRSPARGPHPAARGGRARHISAAGDVAPSVMFEVVRSLDSRDGAAEAFSMASGAAYHALLAPELEAITTRPKELLEQARAFEKDNRPTEARTALEKAFYLDQLLYAVHQSDGEVASAALESLIQLREKQIAAWSKQQPALNKQLDLVLRDMSLADALQSIVRVANMPVKLLDGSIDDAASIVSSERVRVGYSDLRGTTVAEALDRVLLPVGLTWRLENDSVVAASQRRLPGLSGWIYDVSLIALPNVQQIIDRGEHAQATEAIREAAEQFVNTVREQLAIEKLDSVWYGSGRLLIFADQQKHAEVARLFSDLSNAKARLRGAAADLHKITVPRAAERREQLARQRAATHRHRIANLHRHFGWKLLAGAASSELDMEALSHLQIAWKDPATAEMLRDSHAATALRSYWILQQTHEATGGANSELAQLLETARKQCVPAAQESLNALAENHEDTTAFMCVLFASLAQLGDREWMSQALPLLTTKQPGESPLAHARTVAYSLLADRHDIRITELTSVLQAGPEGDDLTLLTALACHRAGEEMWSLLRQSAGSAGNQPPSGEVVVILNRLTGSPLVSSP